MRVRYKLKIGEYKQLVTVILNRSIVESCSADELILTSQNARNKL